MKDPILEIIEGTTVEEPILDAAINGILSAGGDRDKIRGVLAQVANIALKNSILNLQEAVKQASAAMKLAGGYKVGERMFALRDADETTVNLYGFGVYDGDQPCPLLGGSPNPRITLDSGDVVWGCQCWWGPETKFQAEFGKLAVVNVPVPV